MWRNFFRGGRISERAKKVLIRLIFIYFMVAFCAVLSLSTNEPTASTYASSIISDLRNMKAAALMLRDERPEPLQEGANHIMLLATYLDNPKFMNAGRYAYIISGDAHWYGYNFGNNEFETHFGKNVRSKLTYRAKRAGLYGSLHIDKSPISRDKAHLYQATNDAVWIPAY